MRKWWQRVCVILQTFTCRTRLTLLPQVLPDSMACRLYVLTVLVETTIDLIIEGDLLLRFHQADNSLQSQDSSSANDIQLISKKMPAYLTIFGFAQCVQANATFLFCFVLSANVMFVASFNWSWHWTPCTLETPYNFSHSRESDPTFPQQFVYNTPRSFF
jgi:hypothetical protein